MTSGRRRRHRRGSLPSSGGDGSNRGRSAESDAGKRCGGRHFEVGRANLRRGAENLRDFTEKRVIAAAIWLWCGSGAGLTGGCAAIHHGAADEAGVISREEIRRKDAGRRIGRPEEETLRFAHRRRAGDTVDGKGCRNGVSVEKELLGRGGGTGFRGGGKLDR